MNSIKKLAIIGGGAAGLAAAIAASDAARACGAQVEVAVYEADDRVGRSILATGNGRCNFSNSRIDARLYRNADFVLQALDGLNCATVTKQSLAGSTCASVANPVHTFFEDIGLAWREEAEGRLYPLANKAVSVLEVLRVAAGARGVQEVCDHRAVSIAALDNADRRFHVRFADGVVVHADAVVVAVGGGVPHALLSKVAPEVPFINATSVLGPLRTDVALVKPLNNIRVRAAVSLVASGGALKAREEGEILFRDYGVSGIAVFNLSRFAQSGDSLLIDLLPQVPAADSESFLQRRSIKLEQGLLCQGRLTVEDLLRGTLLPAVAHVVAKVAGLKLETIVDTRALSRLVPALKALPLAVRGVGEARQCQVRRGGVGVAAIDAHTMEVRCSSGLYVAGESLDVDAPCGGYNLHWAWASGLLAGRAAASRLC